MPMTLSTNAMTLAELQTDVLKKLWIQFDEEGDGGPPVSAFSKYSVYRINKKLNQIYSEMVCISKSMRSWFIIPLKQYYPQYQVPLNCFDIEKVYYFSSATAYTELEVLEETIVESRLGGWRTAPATPELAFVSDRNKMSIMLGVAPAPVQDATAITFVSGRVESTSSYGTIEAVSGVAASLGNTATRYVDSLGQNFRNLGVIEGTTILNISDGSSGVITSLSTTNTPYDSIDVTALTGGSTNTWSAADSMKVVNSGSYGNIIEVGDIDAQFILSPTNDLPNPGLVMAANNLLVRGYMYPTLLVNKTQYPELSPMFHPYIALGAAGVLGKEEPVDTPEYAQALKYDEEYKSIVAVLSSFVKTQYKSENFSIQSKRVR